MPEAPTQAGITAPSDLFATATRNAATPVLRAALERCLCLPAGAAPFAQFLALHPRDQMLSHSLAEHRHADTALRQYFVREHGDALHAQYAPRALAKEQDLHLVARRTVPLTIAQGGWG